MKRFTDTIVESDDKRFLYWNQDYYKKVKPGAKFWGWGKRKGKCRYFVFWIPFGEGCGECHFN